MKLITAAILKRLQKNFETHNNEDIPLKLFNASGGQTWLITQIEPDGDIMWGLADLGFGIVEYGPISLNELLECKRTMGSQFMRTMGFQFMLERDKFWKGGKVSTFVGRNNLAGC